MDVPLSQRDLRNQSAEVIKRLTQGTSFLLTNNGRPVGRLTPVDAPGPGLRITRPAIRRGGWQELAPRQAPHTGDLEQIIDELREDSM